MGTPSKVASPDVVCSFCGRASSVVGRIVAGPAVYICNDCVGLCVGVLAESGAPGEAVLPWRVDTDLATVLGTLPRMALAQRQASDHLGRWVGRARELGATWADIGAALGMTRQSAWERFSNEA